MIGAIDFSAMLNAAGWMVLHSLWQITLVWIGVQIALRVIAPKFLEVRYWAMVAGLVCMMGFPFAKLLTMSDSFIASQTAFSDRSDFSGKISTSNETASAARSTDITKHFVADNPVSNHAEDKSSNRSGSNWMPVGRSIDRQFVVGDSTNNPINNRSRESGQWLIVVGVAQSYLPTLGVVWLLGSLFASVRIVFGWWNLNCIRRKPISAPSSVMAAFSSACKRLGVTRTISVIANSVVDTPSVFGILRPVVVVPIGLANGLSPVELELILAHELAHVRRYDLWINGLQLAAESLLFYHPCVWWLNHSIRLQREMCCDAMAAETEVQRFELGTALLKLETRRDPIAKLSLAATDGDLLLRIRTLCGESNSYRSLNAPWGLAAFWIVLTSVIFYSANRATLAGMDPPSPTQTATATNQTAAQAPNAVAGENSAPIEPTASPTQTPATTSNSEAKPAKPETKKGVLQVAGTVVGPNGQPIVNAFVELPIFGRKILKRSLTNLSSHTDESGHFELIQTVAQDDGTDGQSTDFDIKESFLWVYALGYNVKCVRPAASPSGRLECNIQLTDATFLPIKVTDDDGNPQSGVHVEPNYFEVPNGVYESDQSTGLSCPAPTGILSRLRVTTDENGYAELDCIPKALIDSVAIFKDSIAPQYHSFGSQNASKQPTALKLRPTGDVAGEFVGGTPELFKDYQIVLESTAGPNAAQVTSRVTVDVDEQGRFKAVGLMAGKISTPHGFGWDPDQQLQPDVMKEFTLEPNTTEEVQILLSPGTLIRGRLITEDDKTPVTNTLISISTTRLGTSNGARMVVESDSNGEYEAYVTPGVVNIQAYDSSRWPSCQRYNYPSLISVVVPSKDDAFPVQDLVFKPYKTEPAALVSSSGKPLANRRIALITSTFGHAAKFGTTDDNGDVQLTVLYDVRGFEQKNAYWVAFPEGTNVGAIDARKLPRLVVKQASPLVLVSEEDE